MDFHTWENRRKRRGLQVKKRSSGPAHKNNFSPQLLSGDIAGHNFREGIVRECFVSSGEIQKHFAVVIKRYGGLRQNLLERFPEIYRKACQSQRREEFGLVIHYYRNFSVDSVYLREGVGKTDLRPVRYFVY